MPEQQEFSHISIPNNVADAIRDNLPQQVSKVLREELEKGIKAREKVGKLTADLKKVEALNDEHGEIKSARRSLEREEKNLANHEKDLAKREARRGQDLAEHMLDCEKRYSLRLEGALAGLVRNVEWRKDVLDFESAVSYGTTGRAKEVKTPKNTSEEAV